MNHMKYTALRISLIVAVVAAVAAAGIAQFELRPKIRKLTEQRDSFRKQSEERLVRADTAEAYGRELADQIANQKKQLDAARLESKRLTDQNTRVVIDLEETRVTLNAAKQELARWNATGTSADQVAFLVKENKTLKDKTAQLEKQRN